MFMEIILAQIDILLIAIIGKVARFERNVYISCINYIYSLHCLSSIPV